MFKCGEDSKDQTSHTEFKDDDSSNPSENSIDSETEQVTSTKK